MDAQHVIVAVAFGPLSGRKAVLAPGDVVRFGRGERAGFVVPNDPRMSAIHFELAWDGERCRFRDLRSASGTLLNGEPGKGEAELAHGDWLKAGKTVFTVSFEAATAPRGEEAIDAEASRKERAEVALAALREEAVAAPLYALVDGARERRILELLRESVEEARSLYDGVEGEALAHVAPYLVRIREGSRLLEALVREGWGKRWGVWLTSRMALNEVRRQLRRFLMVELEARRGRVYFRFYDPRTLTVFVPTCTPRQADEFFGGIDAFFAEGDRGALERFHRPRHDGADG
jgi:Domain of unknown function (DUF4123)/Inner membrane component of T3SS, cytoplasmic domain